MSGKLIVFEGPDEVGKSTLADSLMNKFRATNEKVELLSFPGKEAGTLGELVYKLHHEPNIFGLNKINETSLQILHVAAHADAIQNKIRPLIKQDTNVILDRFWWSTLVYGAVGGVKANVLNALIALEDAMWYGKEPDMLFLIDRDEPFVEVPDMANWKKIREGYHQLAEKNNMPYPVYIISNKTTVDEAVNSLLAKITQTHGRISKSHSQNQDTE